MTTIIAYRDGVNAYLSSDGRVSDAYDIDSDHANKIYKFNHFLMGFAGDCCDIEYLIDKLQEPISIFNKKRINDMTIDEVILKIKKLINNIDISNVEILFVDKNTIVKSRIYSSRYSHVEICGKCVSIGSGSKYAKSYLVGCLENVVDIDIEVLLEKSILYTTSIDKGSGGKIKTIKL